MSLKIGIVVDNYKIEKFRNALKEAKLNISFEGYLTKDKKTYLFQVLCEPFQVDEIRKICTVLQINFNQGN